MTTGTRTPVAVVAAVLEAFELAAIVDDATSVVVPTRPSVFVVVIATVVPPIDDEPPSILAVETTLETKEPSEAVETTTTTEVPPAVSLAPDTWEPEDCAIVVGRSPLVALAVEAAVVGLLTGTEVVGEEV
ncbi:hypothetical protein Tdes44962_MAKER09276 [Teratosphaeria destructans]|uniref:Uncharacterized protein n=1 Tax=Teratosphaeria destructans TaxID=418781 RepID=A0A9W7STJ5_9PEZI|nr:hypothetical protein Tdes44962_MAKER09276 [Teratosphaeria destructans]